VAQEQVRQVFLGVPLIPRSFRTQEDAGLARRVELKAPILPQQDFLVSAAAQAVLIHFALEPRITP